MGTILQVKVWARDAEAGFGAIEAALGEVRRIDEMLSSWRADSELSRLNAAIPGATVELSAELFALLGEVRAWAEASGGAFDPALGPLIDIWDLRGPGRRPSQSEIARAVAASGLDGFEFDESLERVVRLRPDVWLTAGGFGKGVALRAARAALKEAGISSAFLDFGGQILAIGAPEGQASWAVGVAHPGQRQRCVAELRLSQSSAATSAASERFIEVGGTRFGHLLDPRTGWPVPAWGSVTVVAEDPLLADMASTTLFVLGPEVGLRWAEARADLGVLFIEYGGDGLVANWNGAMRPWLSRSELLAASLRDNREGRDSIRTCVTEQHMP